MVKLTPRKSDQHEEDLKEVSWYDNTPNEPIDYGMDSVNRIMNEEKPKRVVRVRKPDERVEEERIKILELKSELEDANQTIQSQNATILRLQQQLYEASQNHPTQNNEQAKIELAVLRRRIAGYKMTGKISILRDLDSIKELL